VAEIVEDGSSRGAVGDEVCAGGGYCSVLYDRCSFPAAHHFYEFLQILEVCSSSRTSVAMIKCGESVLAKSHLLGKWPLAMAHRMTAHLDLTSFL
jgi:hypothetical protein